MDQWSTVLYVKLFQVGPFSSFQKIPSINLSPKKKKICILTALYEAFYIATSGVAPDS